MAGEAGKNGVAQGAVVASVGTGLGTLFIWFLNAVGVELTPAGGAAVAGGVATITMYIVDHGIAGFGKLVWRGRDNVDAKRNGDKMK